MANNKSTKKRIKSDKTKNLRNRYMLKTCKTFIKNLKRVSDKDAYATMLGEAVSKLDKLAKNRVIHPNKAANKKSKLYAMLNKMATV